MSQARLLSAIAAALIAVASTSIGTHAEPAAPEQCGGRDILAELQTSEPAIYTAIMDEAAKLENAKAILWKVEKAGVAPSHLFGTIHMADTRVTKLSKTTQKAFDQSSTIALELVGASEAGMMAAVAKVPELLAYNDGTTLSGQLTADEFAKVQKLIVKSGLPAETAPVLKPWLISMMLAISDCNRSQTAAGMKALDDQLEAAAKARGATVIGLETAESQLKAMASVPNDKQILMLKSSLAYADRTDDMIETLVQLYLQRKLGATMPFEKALAAKSGVPASAFDEFIRILLTERNARMRDAATPLLDKGGAFIAVGALHLSGNDGLVTLFRDKGFTVTAVE